MVCGFIQHQQVAWGKQHQGQGQSGFLAAAEFAHLFKHRIVAEAEAAQQGTHLGLGPVRYRLKQGVDHGFLQIQGLGLVLLEIAGDHVVFPEAGAAVVWGFRSHYQAQQR